MLRRLFPLLALPCALLAAPLQADTLHDIYELALKNDPVLKVAEAQYRATREAAPLARAALLPQISGKAEYAYSRKDTNTRTAGIAPGSSAYTNRFVETETDNYSVTLSQALFDMPAWFSFREGKQISRQAEVELAGSQQDLIVRVSEAYFNVLRAEDNLASSRAQEIALQRQLDQAQQRFDVGLIAITDVHEAQAAYDLAVVTRLADEGALGTAYEALTVLTGQEHQNLWVLRRDFEATAPVPASRDEWVQFALQHNYALKAAEYAADAARQGASASAARHLPTLRGGYVYNSDESDGTIKDRWAVREDPFDNKDQGGTAFVTLDVPIFAGGGISAGRRQAYANANRASESYTSVQRNTIQNTRSLHLAVVTDAQRVKARHQAIISAQSALDATRAGYDVGTRNIVDVVQSERFLYQALRDYANSRYDYVINQLRLKQLAGTLSPQDVIDLNGWLETPPPASASQQPDNG